MDIRNYSPVNFVAGVVKWEALGDRERGRGVGEKQEGGGKHVVGLFGWVE